MRRLRSSVRCRPGTCRRRLGWRGGWSLRRLLDRAPSRERDSVLAMICQRALGPGVEARRLSRALRAVDARVGARVSRASTRTSLYAALDWLGERQERIEERLARRHLEDGDARPLRRLLVLLRGALAVRWRSSATRATAAAARRRSSTGCFATGPAGPSRSRSSPASSTTTRRCPLRSPSSSARFGLSRSWSSSRPRHGHQGQPRAARGRCASRLDHGAEGAADQEARRQEGTLQLSLFDEHNLAEIAADDYPGERLIVCRNPLVAAERARKRDDLLTATERALAQIASRVERGTLEGGPRSGSRSVRSTAARCGSTSSS